MEAEVDRRFGMRQSRKRKSLQRELLKWATLVVKAQVHGPKARRREVGRGEGWRDRYGGRGIRRTWNSGLAIGIIV